MNPRLWEPLRRSWYALVLLAVSKPAHAGLPVGIGVLGDSYSDEYEFYPPDRPTARSWVEILRGDVG